MNYLEEQLKAGVPYDQIIPIDIKSYRELVEQLRLLPPSLPVSTGSKELDEIIGGFEPGRLYILSAPTKQGKTTLAQTFMFNMAQKAIPSLMFSYEMGWQEITKKFQDMDKSKNSDLPIFLPMDLHRGGGDLQYQWLFEAMAKAKLEKNIGLAIIDHLHFLIPLKDFKNTSLVIGGVVREIKRIAVTLNIPIILIAHVGMIKDDKVPEWTDIRDSSFITQEADVVLMMYRHKNKKAAKKTSDDSVEIVYTKKAILSVELDRVQGKSGKIALWHDGKMFVPYTGQDGDILEVQRLYA